MIKKVQQHQPTPKTFEPTHTMITTLIFASLIIVSLVYSVILDTIR
ncbi:hypothetical protein VDG1235_1164 [Verrucomicrobiia bacterium DG1235]|nr:hypothetical protein VDG1235_1164 [Verrucomicrobiae bacterium DG1235]